MAMYINKTKDAPIVSLEFSPTIDGNFSFFRLKDKEQVAAVTKELEALGQKIIAQTQVNGQPMLVTRGKRTDYNLLDSLEEKGITFKAPQPVKKLNMWKLRGWASMIGQPLQIASGFMTKGTIDSATIGFGTLNMIANVANITLGAEKSNDINQLRFLKRKFNYELSKYLPGGATSLLPSSYDDRIHLRGSKEKPPSFGSRIASWLKRHSVSFCEIGLRYVGSVMLIFPIVKWGDGLEAFGKGLKPLPEAEAAKMSLIRKVGGAFSKGAGAAFNVKDKYTGYVGMGYVAGKTLAFSSKVADPYDTKPHTWMDTFREKVVFRLSSSIEAVAAAVLAYDRLLRKLPDGKFARTINYKHVTNLLEPLVAKFSKTTPAWLARLKTAETRDWVGGIGGVLFTGGLLVRIFAPFGKKEVDLKELNAHIVDGLAQIPQEKLPEVIANFASYLTEHFKGQVEFGEVYKELTDGLYRHHGIALPGVELPTSVQEMHKAGFVPAAAEPEQAAPEKAIKEPLAANGEMKPPASDAKAKTFAQENLRSPKEAYKSVNISHVEKAAANDASVRSMTA